MVLQLQFAYAVCFNSNEVYIFVFACSLWKLTIIMPEYVTGGGGGGVGVKPQKKPVQIKFDTCCPKKR